MKPVHIDIISDLVCPWCYIGRKRVGDALAQWPQLPVQIQWQPFELFPQLPPAGVERQAHMAQLFGSAQKRDAIFAHVAAAGRADGLDLKFRGITVSPNTFDLHRLVWKAYPAGFQDDLVNAFFRAFFTQHRDLSQPATLIDIMAAFGWSAAATRRFLDTDEGRAEVQARRLLYRQFGVSSVPFYIINNTLTISGAQPTDVFVAAIRKAAFQKMPVTPKRAFHSRS